MLSAGGYGQGPPSARASGFFCFFIDLKRNCNIRKCDFGPKSRQKLFRIFNRIQHQGSETFKLPYYGTRPSRCPTVTSLERLLAINQKLPLACVLLSHISDISALVVHVVLILESNFCRSTACRRFRLAVPEVNYVTVYHRGKQSYSLNG